MAFLVRQCDNQIGHRRLTLCIQGNCTPEAETGAAFKLERAFRRPHQDQLPQQCIHLIVQLGQVVLYPANCLFQLRGEAVGLRRVWPSYACSARFGSTHESLNSATVSVCIVTSQNSDLRAPRHGMFR